MPAWIVFLLALMVGCRVPTPQTVTQLEVKARQGDTGAVGSLLNRLGREAPREERSEAYRALLGVGERNGSEILAACRDSDAVRREHALALAANLRIDGVYDAAVGALGDASFPRRYVAAWALGEIGDPRGGQHLVGALGHGGQTAREAARSLVKLGTVSTPMVLDALPRLGGEARGYALRVLGELRDPRATDVLVEALSDPNSRADAARSLGKLGSPQVAESLMARVSDSDWRVRIEVVRALGLLEARDSEATLEELRTSDPVVAVREWAARSLAVFSGEPQKYPNGRGEWVLPDNLYR